MQARDIMSKDVKTASAGDTFAQIAKTLHDNHISSVIVEEDGRVAGIVTERDLVNMVADGLDPSAVTAGERMTRDLATLEPRSDIADAARLMAEKGIRHLPVLERGKLAGIISIRDLSNWAVEELTGGHELADLERGHAALSAAAEVRRRR
jgi:CBS domain-containing protein